MTSARSTPLNGGTQRMTLRVVTRDADARVQEVREQEIPTSLHEVGLFLRRAPFREQIADAMLAGGTITIERKEGR